MENVIIDITLVYYRTTRSWCWWSWTVDGLRTPNCEMANTGSIFSGQSSTLVNSSTINVIYLSGKTFYNWSFGLPRNFMILFHKFVSKTSFYEYLTILWKFLTTSFVERLTKCCRNQTTWISWRISAGPFQVFHIAYRNTTYLDFSALNNKYYPARSRIQQIRQNIFQ